MDDIENTREGIKDIFNILLWFIEVNEQNDTILLIFDNTGINV